MSANDGWLLAEQPCRRDAMCARVIRTTDGGASWHELPNPGATFAYGVYGCVGGCVGNLAFAPSGVGYLYGPNLLMTTDRGTTWRRVGGLEVEALTIAAGRAWRVAYGHSGCPGPCQPVLQSAPLGSTAWRTVLRTLETPGRSGSAQIVASGATLMLALYGSQAGPVSAQAVVYRSADDGVSWKQQADPCSLRGRSETRMEQDLNQLAATPTGFIAGVCSPHEGSGAFLVTSADAGATWTIGPTLPTPNGQHPLLAVATPSRFAAASLGVGGSGSSVVRLLISSDAGRRWSTVATAKQSITQSGIPSDLAFQDARDGTWIGGARLIWSTTDGGVHWHQTTLG